MTKLKVNGPWSQFVDPLVGREAFVTGGKLWGSPHLPVKDYSGHVPAGQLPQENWESYAGSTYAVYSYETPIAWVDKSGDWVVPDVKYSVTTSKHQGRINAALTSIWHGQAWVI